MFKTLLLACGILSSLVYLMTDITATLQWDGYSYIDQAVSELAALDAPSRPVAVVMFAIYNLMVIAFGAGVVAAFADARLRTAAYALATIGLLGSFSVAFPIQQRGQQMGLNESMHLILTGCTVVCIVVAMSFGSRVAGRRFYVYSMVSIAAALLAGAGTAFYAGRLENGLPTPWFGALERVSIFTYLAWVVVFATVLLRARAREAPLPRSADGMLHA